MKQKLLFIFLLYSFFMQSQCFDCAKNFGGWTDDAVADLKKTNDAIYLIKNSSNFGVHAGLYKFDLNCNLIWKKEIDNFKIYASKVATDSEDNIYILITWTDAHNSVGPFPIIFNGFPMYPGLNLFKFDKNGLLLWNKSLGRDTDYGMRDVFVHNDNVYVTGKFYNSMNIDNQVTLTNPTSNGYLAGPPLLFIAKFTNSGLFLDAKYFGNGDEYLSSEIDSNGNLYFSRYKNSGPYRHADIDKIDSNLNVIWSKEISNSKITTQSSFKPTQLHYNPNNNKLYLWSAFYKFANVLGTVYTDPQNAYYITQSLLCEFNVSNGNLERIKQFNNSSTLPIPGIDGSYHGNTGYLTEKDNDLYVFSSFTRKMDFDNISVTSSQKGSYNKEELVLFKVNLDNFKSEFILKSFAADNFNSMSTDAAGPILFNGNNLYLTSTFQSSPLSINNILINNNSGNNNSDVMLYKYNLDPSQISTGTILAEKTCFNQPVNFEVKGTFDSILWDFDDPNSTTNNSATINNPQHQFTAVGTYNVSAVIKCGTETQTLKKEIVITNVPKSIILDPVYACESTSGTGISNSFDTSNLNSKIIDNQTNLIVEYRDSNGNLLPSPLPNPYTNTVKNEEVIKVKSYFASNPTCFFETDLKFITNRKPENLLISSPQTFCVQQNAKLDDIQITGQNIKWYSNLTGGTLVPNTTVLQDNATYYASQTVNGCESERVPVKINIQVTFAPTGNANQSFCTGQNPTIASIQVTGTSIKWYDALNNGNLLPETTNLENGKTYYASQTVNSCEGSRFGVTVSIVNSPSPPSGNPEQSFCKKENKTLNDIQINGQNIKWFDTNFSAAPLPNTTLLENNRTYYASQTIGCEGDRTPILVHVYDTPLPTGNNNQQFCIDEIAIIENLNINGTALKWYDSALNGNLLSETALLQNTVYYVSQTLNNCESERFAIKVKIQDTEIPIADSRQIFCIQKNTKISDIVISGQNIKWYENQSSNIPISESTLLENRITYYASQTINNCESDRIPVAISILEATNSDCINFAEELPYPKFFTPNGDGFNDFWTIDSAYLAPGTRIKIFNQYGKLLKELGINTSWDGTFIGQLQPATDYWFTAIRSDGKELRGHFSLKR
ncbi:T9SS type B sorting domain-containing protein [Flavobacterium johnsoniae]|uniref:Ig-like domain-containing protein n=1 Tax=Flavobacterium johnsoniae TaxID=986 RepID=UPI0025B0956B|nr:T9SS type B sorting domain-containing protein [Flavobacterium johnsoniae]WJS94778.1 T9SS type B sorting domain-containing protein [Flavobacterium johnsoniae]